MTDHHAGPLQNIIHAHPIEAKLQPNRCGNNVRRWRARRQILGARAYVMASLKRSLAVQIERVDRAITQNFNWMEECDGEISKSDHRAWEPEE